MNVRPFASLTVAQRGLYFAALNSNAAVATRVSTLTLSHQLVGSITPVMLDGQVNYLADSPLSRTLQMGFLDPAHALMLDSDSPTQGVGGMDRLLQVEQFVSVDALDAWVGVPVFTGRPEVIERDGDTVTVEAQSKECLHLRGVDPFTIKKGTPVTTAIRRCLAGETRFRFPAGITRRLASNIVVGGTEAERQPWVRAQRFATGLGMQLFYDASGWVVMRRPPTVPAWTLTEHGEDANLLGRVQVRTGTMSSIRNRVIVIGKTKATKTRKARNLVGRAVLPASNPLSAQSLATNGRPWYNTERYEMPELHTQAAVNAYAAARLNDLAAQQIDVTGSAVPVWHLQTGDLLALDKVGATTNFRLKDASVPVGPSDSGMSIGFLSRTRSPRAGRLPRRRVA